MASFFRVDGDTSDVSSLGLHGTICVSPLSSPKQQQRQGQPPVQDTNDVAFPVKSPFPADLSITIAKDEKQEGGYDSDDRKSLERGEVVRSTANSPSIKQKMNAHTAAATLAAAAAVNSATSSSSAAVAPVNYQATGWTTPSNAAHEQPTELAPSPFDAGPVTKMKKAAQAVGGGHGELMKRLQGGVSLLKIPRRGAPKQTMFYLTRGVDGQHVMRWESKKKKSEEACVNVQVCSLILGQGGGQFAKRADKLLKEHPEVAQLSPLSFSVMSPKRSVDVIALSEVDYDAWVQCLRPLCATVIGDVN